MTEFHQWLKKRLTGKKVAVLGMGIEGLSSFNHLLKSGVEVYRVGDQRKTGLNFPEEKCYWGDRWLEAIQGADVVIRSPGIHPNRLREYAGDLNFELSGQIDLMLEFAKAKVIGVTGTLGKGSTVSILSHLFEAAGISYGLGGNFGVPAWDLTEEKRDWYVLELSSFQLYTLKTSPHFAGLLQITSEHLDWHVNTLDYQNSKGNLVKNQESGDFCFYLGNFEGTARLASASKAKKVNLHLPDQRVLLNGDLLSVDGVEICPEDCLGLGRYQMQNRAVAAAIALEIGVEVPVVVEGCKSWPGLPLRMEQVGQKEELIFVNDSYATRPEATLGAVNSMSYPFSLILGGSEKNADFAPLAKSLAENKLLKGVVLIGQTRERLALTLEELNVPMVFGESAEEAFASAEKLLDFRGKRALLFSPACASFGMFQNYKHRGEVFNEWVRKRM